MTNTDPATSTAADSRTCQVCSRTFDTPTEKAVHATNEHDLGRRGTDRTKRFIACECGSRTFVGETCEDCGLTATAPEWAG